MKAFSSHQRLVHCSRNVDQLYLQFEAFVKQRENNLNRASTKMMDHFSAISRLKRVLDFYRYSSHEDLCRAILKAESDLRLLIPSPNSRFYQGAIRKVYGMLDYAKNYLNQ